MIRPHLFEARPGVGGRPRRFLGGAWRIALSIGLLAVAVVNPGVAADAAPGACTAIEQPQLTLVNLGEEGRGRLILRGRLPAAALSGAPSLGEGELRIEDLAAVEPIFAMTTTPEGGTGDCGRSHTRRSRALRRLPVIGGDCPAAHSRAVLRIADNASGGGGRFVLRARGESLRPPLGPLRVTVVVGVGEGGCSRWTFPPEDCSLDAGGTVLSCRSHTSESARDCKRTGCSGQLCSDEHVVTTCEFRSEYACYRDAACEPQPGGDCGWTPTEDLARCLAETRGPPMPPPVPGVPRATWFACGADDECLVYPGLDCCGCAVGGGPEVAINREAKGEVDAYRLCPDIACPAEYLCRDGLEAVCRAGRCEIE